MRYAEEKVLFARELKAFAAALANEVTQNDEWTIRGFIDIFKNIYTISADTKVVSKILELQLFPYFLGFAERIKYRIELASRQNWYPDLTFVSQKNTDIKFAVDLKTTYRDKNYPGFCNGFTLGSHGKYFIDRTSAKNIQYPYAQYSGHFCLGIIYSRSELPSDEELHTYSVDDIESVPVVIRNFTFFAEEKWKIAGDKSGSGNTANIGSIQYIPDILKGNGIFAKAGEEYFDDYWANYGKLEIADASGKRKKLSSFAEYLRYRNLPESLNNPKPPKRRKGHG